LLSLLSIFSFVTSRAIGFIAYSNQKGKSCSFYFDEEMFFPNKKIPPIASGK
jgi:hypothetical protein